MIDITTDAVLDIQMLDDIARFVLGDDISGVSVSSNSRIHITNDTPANRAKAQAIFDNWDGLDVGASTTAMTEGDSDPVITCNDSLIVGDADVGYMVLLDGQLYADGTTTVSSGVATLNLVAPIAGVYAIYLYRLTGNYASGFVQITVNEV